MSSPAEHTPSDVLRTALVAMLADLLREVDSRIEEYERNSRRPQDLPSDWFHVRSQEYQDAAAIRRVMEILQRTGGAGRDARAREGTPATPEGGANPSPSTKPWQEQSFAEAEDGGS